MHFLSVIDRVYINISNMYNEHGLNFNINKLIDEVARVNPNGDTLPLYDYDSEKIFKGRTKKFIVKKVKTYIADLLEQAADENMASFASLRQLEKLIKLSESENKRISCYGLVYLYIIYTLLERKSPYAEQCLLYVTALHQLVFDYFEENQDDELAEFFHGCYEPIINAMKLHDCNLDNQLLPPRPRRYPTESQE